MKEILLSFLFAVGISTLGYSCICMNPNFPLRYLAQNDTLSNAKKHFIIKGKVIGELNGKFSAYGAKGYKVLMLESWPSKNSLTDTLTIIDEDVACPVFFHKDSTYLIGAYPVNKYFGTSPCQGTSLYSKHKNLVCALGEGKKAKKTLENFDQPNNKTTPNDFSKLILAITLGLSLILNFYFIRRKS